MASDVDYSDRADGQDALIVALERLLDRIMADNPIATVPQGLFHFEIRTYPEIALREALLNAFVHADYRIHGPILVKQFKHRIEIGNPGGLPGGITPDNILRHEPVPRNPALVDALTRLRLVNRSNLGVRRIYQSLLIEGKEPPQILDEGEAVRVVLRASDLSVPFRLFVAKEADRGISLGVELLLILQHLLRHPEIDTATAARITQQTETDARETLSLAERAPRLHRARRRGPRHLLGAAPRPAPAARGARPPRARPAHRLGGGQDAGAEHPHPARPARRCRPVECRNQTDHALRP